jgi:perosamine synthetase
VGAVVRGGRAPLTPPDREPVWQTYAVTVDEALDRDAIALGLRSHEIGCNIGTYAMHREPIYATKAECPVSKSLFEQHLALPMFPDLTEAEQDRVVETLAKVIVSL